MTQEHSFWLRELQFVTPPWFALVSWAVLILSMALAMMWVMDHWKKSGR